MATVAQSARDLPKPDADFYQVAASLSDAEREVLKRVRTFMEGKVATVINKYWAEDSFPFDLVPAFRDLKIAGAGYEGYGCAGGTTLLAALSPWKSRGSTARSQRSSASTAVWRWDRFSCAGRKSRKTNGCRPWLVWK